MIKISNRLEISHAVLAQKKISFFKVKTERWWTYTAVIPLHTFNIQHNPIFTDFHNKATSTIEKHAHDETARQSDR